MPTKPQSPGDRKQANKGVNCGEKADELATKEYQTPFIKACT